jgi:succinate-acetate transporter protein
MSTRDAAGNVNTSPAKALSARISGLADPVPLGLGLAIFYCGHVQLLARMRAFRRGKTSAAVAFSSYAGGLSYFFLGYFIAPHLAASVAGEAVGLYLLCWLIFTCCMTIAAPRTSAGVLCVFVTLTAAYLLLVPAELGVATSSLLPVAGYVGITCGVAWSVALAPRRQRHVQPRPAAGLAAGLTPG